MVHIAANCPNTDVGKDADASADVKTQTNMTMVKARKER